MILALETVFSQCSVALLSLDGEVIIEQTLTGDRQQTQQILPLIQTIMIKRQVTFCDLTAIAFNRGPGAFSGIRINTAVAQALAFAHDLPCLPVSSLQAVAQTAYINKGLSHVYAVIDARMNEVYVGEFWTINDEVMMRPVRDNSEYLLPYGQLPVGGACQLVGDGARLLLPKDGLESEMSVSIWDDVIPTASIIGQIGATILKNGDQVTAENALPVYLRHNAWKTLAEQGKQSTAKC